jgi:hypothetical protein
MTLQFDAKDFMAGKKKGKMKKDNQQPNIVIYTTEDGQAKLQVKIEDETVWLTQEQMAELFDKGRTTITEHIQNAFKEGELDENSVCREFRRTGSDGKDYGVKHYNLDVIISVGYRVKSLRGTQFRMWATQRLREYIIKGFALDDERLKQAHFNLKRGANVLVWAVAGVTIAVSGVLLLVRPVVF